MATTLQQKLRRPSRSKRYRTIKEALGEVKRDTDGRKLCRLCATRLPKFKQRWCSDACRDQAYLQCSPGHMRAAVRRRDKGVCARCGLDTVKLRDELRDLCHKYGRDGEAYRSHLLLMWGPWVLRSPLWQMNHKQAVAEGGEIWGLKNVETLCIPCHQEHTKMLRKRLAWRGKGRVRNAPVPSNLYLGG